MVCGVPTAVHVTPSLDWYPVNTLPVRTSRTHRGAAMVASVVLTDVPPLVVRRRKEAPRAADMSMKAWAEPGSRVCRIITPAFDQTLTLATLCTRATIETSPVAHC